MSKIRQPKTETRTIVCDNTLFLHMFPSHGYRIKFSFQYSRISKLESLSLGRTFVLFLTPDLKFALPRCKHALSPDVTQVSVQGRSLRPLCHTCRSKQGDLMTGLRTFFSVYRLGSIVYICQHSSLPARPIFLFSRWAVASY